METYNSGVVFYSLKEICEMFQISESSLKTNFIRTTAAIKKKYGVDVIKSQKGNQIFYQVIEDERAVSLYNESNDIVLSIESLSFETYEFFVFLGLAAMPQGVFRGMRAQFLKYIGIKNNSKNIQILNKVFDSLVKRRYIEKQQDEDIIIVYLRAAAEKQLIISIDMIRECKKIADQNNKNTNKFIQLIKVWQAIKICEQHQPFTYKELVQLTGLSYKQIRDVKKLLESDQIFISNRAGSYLKCLGMNVQLNGFFN